MSTKTQAKIPAVISKDKNLLAVVSKLNTDVTDEKPRSLNGTNFPDISESIKEKIDNNETIVKLFPDIELSIQIMVSSILAPNDMGNTNLIYSNEGLELPTDVKIGLLDTIKTYISTNYKLEDKLSTIVREAMFTKGAYIEAVIPEASVDAMINAGQYQLSVEDLVENQMKESSLHILGSDEDKSTTYSLEDMDLSISNEAINKNISITVTEDDLGVTITDNIAILGATAKISELASERISLEMYDKEYKDEKALFDSLFKETPVHKGAGSVTVFTKDENSRESVGMPLVMKLPVESTIPVYISGDPTKHLGYFILLDAKGVPITAASDFNLSDDGNDNSNQAEVQRRSIVEKADIAINGYAKKDPTLDNIEEIYTHIINQRLRKKLTSGMLGDLADFSGDNGDVYKIMLTRVLAKQQTKILFMPAELVSYYAFKHRSNGTGESLLETISVLSSIRAILLFSRIMANVKNSINTTEVSATLDDADLDPSKTMKKIVSEVMKSRGTTLPIGITRTEDIVDWTKKVGFRFNFKHKDLPDMDITTSDESTSKVIPDSDLDEEVRKQILMAFSLPPKAVEDGYDSDFAATIVQNNILFTKRVVMQQDILMPLVTNHVHMLLKNDMRIYNLVGDAIKKNYKKIIKSITTDDNKETLKGVSEDKLIPYLTNLYIDNIKVKLPRIEEHETDNMKEAYDNYKEGLEDVIDNFFGDESLPDELTGEMSDSLDGFRTALYNTLMRKWMSDNNYMPELLNATSVDKEGNPLLDAFGEYDTYLKTISEILIPAMKANKKLVDKIDKKIEKIEGEDDEEENVDEAESNDVDEGSDTDVDNDIDNDADVDNDSSGDDTTGDSDDGVEENEDEGDAKEPDFS